MCGNEVTHNAEQERCSVIIWEGYTCKFSDIIKINSILAAIFHVLAL